MNDTVNIGGKDRPISLGFTALRKFTKEYGITLAELGTKLGAELDLDKSMGLIFHALKDGARKAKEPFDSTIDDLGDWIDEAGVDKFNDVFEVVMEQYSAGEGNQDSPSQEKK